MPNINLIFNILQGLLLFGPEGDDTHVSTLVVGTHGYATP